MFDALLQTAQALLIQPSCPICRASLEGNPAAKTGAELQPCGLCIEGYALGKSNTSRNEPLPWKALCTYQGEFRKLVLQIKQQPQSRTGRSDSAAYQPSPPPPGSFVGAHSELEKEAK